VVGQGKRVIPHQPNKRRKRGVRKKQVSFRAPDSMRVFIEERAASANADVSDVVRKMVETSQDAFVALGPLWWEIERRSNVGGKSTGAVLAELAMASIERERPPKK